MSKIILMFEQDLMTILNSGVVYCPSRDELRELYWQSETESRRLKDKEVVDAEQEFCVLLDELKKEWGYDKFSLFDNKRAELSGLNEQERYINGFYVGMKYAQTGKLEV